MVKTAGSAGTLRLTHESRPRCDLAFGLAPSAAAELCLFLGATE